MITDGEQRKYHNFWTYCVHGLPNTAPDGFKIPFSAGHIRRMPRLTGGPFRYQRYADSYLDVALRYAHEPVKQAVISPSALSLMYPADEIPGYSREQFIDDLLREHETEVRSCLRKGAHKVQIDFTEGAAGGQDRSFRASPPQLHRPEQPGAVAVLRRGPPAHRRAHLSRAATATRPTARTSITPSCLPSLFELKVGNFYVALAGEKDRVRVLKIIRDHMKAGSAGFRRRRRADRPAHRDAGGSPRPGPRSGPIHPGRATRHDRRLRVLAVLRRHLDHPRHGVCEDPCARARHGPRGGNPREWMMALETTRRSGSSGRCAAERPEHPPRPPAGRAGARCRAGSGCGSRSPASATR